MDRFEAISVSTSDLVYVYLHSSMDRFEVLIPKRLCFFHSNLHSSMDRFEVEVASFTNDDGEIFTFQYG